VSSSEADLPEHLLRFDPVLLQQVSVLFVVDRVGQFLLGA
jgi:hypothetical protein